MARAISLIEDQDPGSADLVRAIFGHTGQAYVVGVTGPPGAGKSTLVDRLTAQLRGRLLPDTREPGVGGWSQRETANKARGAGATRAAKNGAGASGVGLGCNTGLKIGVIAVDPTSPFSGGAILGDRVRMQSHAGDAGVFIRSMATRGHLGGLAGATADAAIVLDASGTDVIIIETVGVGQDEIDIVRTADVSIVTLVPGAGDDVQALKAGIMEIADIFVVNKSDREGAERLVSVVEANLALETFAPDEWRPPIVKTIATKGQGVPELVETIWRFRAHTEASQAERRRTRSEFRLRELVSARFLDRLERDVLKPGELSALVDRITAREIDPYSAADDLLRRAL